MVEAARELRTAPSSHAKRELESAEPNEASQDGLRGARSRSA